MSEYTRFVLSVKDIKRFIKSENGLRDDNPYVDDFIQRYLDVNLVYFNGIHKIVRDYDAQGNEIITRLLVSSHSMVAIVNEMKRAFFNDWINQSDLYNEVAKRCKSEIYFSDFIKILDKSEIFQKNGFYIDHYSENSLTMERFIPKNMVLKFIEEEYGDKLIQPKILKTMNLISVETLTRKYNIDYNTALNLLRQMFDSPIEANKIVCKDDKFFLKGEYFDYFGNIYEIPKRYYITENMEKVEIAKNMTYLPRISIESESVINADDLIAKTKSFIPQKTEINSDVVKQDVLKNIIKTFILRHQDLEKEQAEQLPNFRKIEKIKDIIQNLVNLMYLESEYIKKNFKIDINQIINQYKAGKILSVAELQDFFASKIDVKSLIVYAR
ncbi:MAG: hypothetical protein IKZ49_02245 [Alphaproteobacteria bacterium]|nr:hypothetical protein [Alphaproteobacteria bacterium]